MADVVIFGVKDFASLAHFYLRHDSEHRVVAFTVHREFMPAEGEFEGLPVVPLEELGSELSARSRQRLRPDVASEDEPAPRRESTTSSRDAATS